MRMTSEELDMRLTEIESIQKQVSEILYSKNWLVRLFMFKKAMKLDRLAGNKIEQLLKDFS